MPENVISIKFFPSPVTNMSVTTPRPSLLLHSPKVLNALRDFNPTFSALPSDKPPFDLILSYIMTAHSSEINLTVKYTSIYEVIFVYEVTAELILYISITSSVMFDMMK
jgi:hypothetical protein